MKFSSLCIHAGLVAVCTIKLFGSSDITQEAIMTERIAVESAKANAFFDRVYDEGVDRSPLAQSYLGLKKDQDKWDDFTEEHELAELVITVQNLAELQRTVRPDWLDEQTQVSYRLFVAQAEHAIEGWKWHDHNYLFTQQSGLHIEVPEVLINMQQIENEGDARAYLARLQALPVLFGQLITRAEAQAARGILPPRFVFPMLIGSCRDLLAGEPYDDKGTKNALLEDFEGKVRALSSLDELTKQQLIARARAALVECVKPAYEGLIALFEKQEKLATDDDGVWKLPEGRDYYNFLLRGHTTTLFDAEAIHTLGLSEVARIHAAMARIKEQTGFKGDLAAFLKFMREDPQFYYPSTPEGGAAYFKRAGEVIDEMRVRLPEFFGTQPRTPLVLKKVEPFREQGAAAANYRDPSADGSRPGIYYINTYDMRALAIWEMETLAHHEAIPGHHMQTAIAQELENMPKFRKFGGYTAYSEGWALYAEYFPKEFGFYADPYQDFGRLSDELLRAVRLVVDTGIHAKHWTRQQVRDYFRANTAASEQELTSETDRYIVWPGQACAYKVGQLKIIELRELAKKQLGDRFKLREFHDLVLKNGSLPLNLLEENVRNWIARLKG